MTFTRLPSVCVAVLMSALVSGPAQAGFSGDPHLDATLGTAYKLRAGGSGPGVDNGSNVWKCGSSTAPPGEEKCPNSASFTPAEATGGRQAWAVGVAPHSYVDFELVCYIELVFDLFDDTIFEPVLICDLVPVVVQAGTIGRAMTLLEWGTENSITQAFSNEPTSLLAYNENLLDACTPNSAIAQVGEDASCLLNFNHSYVPDNGYESDIRMTDPACSIPAWESPLFPITLGGPRNHDDTDSQYNCLTYHTTPQMSNLPGFYRDTTFLDENDEFNIGFGSAQGHALQGGTTYITSQIFYSPLNLTTTTPPTLRNTSAKHEGAITTRILTLLAVTNCDVTGGVACDYFTVKDAAVGGSADTFTQVIP